MKTFMSLLLASLSISTFAETLTLEQYKELRLKHKDAFETVKEGMVAEGLVRSYRSINDEEIRCFWTLKEVVIATYQAKYLKYDKQTLTEDCADDKKGAVEERLVWVDLLKAHHMEPNYIINYKSINLLGETLFLEGTGLDLENNEKNDFKTKANITKSQFYNTESIVSDHFYYQLFRRGFQDPQTINLEGVEVINPKDGE